MVIIDFHRSIFSLAVQNFALILERDANSDDTMSLRFFRCIQGDILNKVVNGGVNNVNGLIKSSEVRPQSIAFLIEGFCC